MPRLTHVNVTMPPGSEAEARRFYGELLGLREIPKPESIRSRGGCWFDAGGLDIHISAWPEHVTRPEYRHFGLEVESVEVLRQRLEAAGVKTASGKPVPWQRFFAHDPFGHRIEFHEIGGIRAA